MFWSVFMNKINITTGTVIFLFVSVILLLIYTSCNNINLFDFQKNFGLLYAVLKDENDNIYLAASDGNKFYKEFHVACDNTTMPFYLTILPDTTAIVQISATSFYISKDYIDWKKYSPLHQSNFPIFSHNKNIFLIISIPPGTLDVFDFNENSWKWQLDFPNSQNGVESMYKQGDILLVFYKETSPPSQYNVYTYSLIDYQIIDEVSSLSLSNSPLFLFKCSDIYYIGDTDNIYFFTKNNTSLQPIADSASLNIIFISYTIDSEGNFWGAGFINGGVGIAKAEGNNWVMKQTYNLNNPMDLQLVAFNPTSLALRVETDNDKYLFVYNIEKDISKELPEFYNKVYYIAVPEKN